MTIMIGGIIPLGLLALFLWKKLSLLAYASAGMWAVLGFLAFQLSTSPSPAQIQDIYMALFWVCIALVITMVLLPLAIREKKDPEEIYVDDFDHELDSNLESIRKIKRDETRRTRKPRPGYLERTGRV